MRWMNGLHCFGKYSEGYWIGLDWISNEVGSRLYLVRLFGDVDVAINDE